MCVFFLEMFPESQRLTFQTFFGIQTFGWPCRVAKEIFFKSSTLKVRRSTLGWRLTHVQSFLKSECPWKHRISRLDDFAQTSPDETRVECHWEPSSCFRVGNFHRPWSRDRPIREMVQSLWFLNTDGDKSCSLWWNGLFAFGDSNFGVKNNVSTISDYHPTENSFIFHSEFFRFFSVREFFRFFGFFWIDVIFWSN